MASLYCPHWIPLHRSSEDADTFRRWNPPFIKIVCNSESSIPYLEDVPPSAKIVVRPFLVSENWNDRSGNFNTFSATRAAAVCDALAYNAAAKGIAHDRLIFEALNEPQLWAGETPAKVAAYYADFTKFMHSYNLHVCIGNFGVGWPGNTGDGTPVSWDFFKPAIEAMRPGDYLGLHEYWGSRGPSEGWSWLAGRFVQCPYDVPILITECGIDLGVEGKPKEGWMNCWPSMSMDAKAGKYIAELFQYEDCCRKDSRVKGLFPFTYDGNKDDWGRFAINVPAFLGQWLPALAARGGTVTPPPVLPPPDPGDPPTPPTVDNAAVLAELERVKTQLGDIWDVLVSLNRHLGNA